MNIIYGAAVESSEHGQCGGGISRELPGQRKGQDFRRQTVPGQVFTDKETDQSL